MNQKNIHSKPIVLVLGASGQLGKLMVTELQKEDSIVLRVTSRDKSKAMKGIVQTCFMDLDYPETFAEALEGVNRVFLLSGYSFSMMTQSKTFLDAAKKAGVEHLVHLGVFSRQWDCSTPHFAWHQMIEAYIKTLGFKWTFLHPNCFLQNLVAFSLIRNGSFRWYSGEVPCGWVALEDVAACASKVLVEGPEKHQYQDYWFSTEVKSLSEMAQLLSQVIGQTIEAEALTSEDFLNEQKTSGKVLDPYFYSVAESFKQIEAGQMPYISTLLDDCQKLLGRKGISIEAWMKMHREELSKCANAQDSSLDWGKLKNCRA